MPKLKSVEKRIWDVEDFDVRFLHKDGRDVRGDMKGVMQYPYERKAKNDISIAEWKELRFHPNYPEFDVDVLDGDGNSATGQMHLSTLRDSYESDED